MRKSLAKNSSFPPKIFSMYCNNCIIKSLRNKGKDDNYFRNVYALTSIVNVLLKKIHSVLFFFNLKIIFVPQIRSSFQKWKHSFSHSYKKNPFLSSISSYVKMYELTENQTTKIKNKNGPWAKAKPLQLSHNFYYHEARIVTLRYALNCKH